MKSEYLRQFLISHPNDWAKLLTHDPYNLKISTDGPLVMFSYNQLSSDFSLPIVQEARGCILDSSPDAEWKYVCRAFDKFGNYGESYVKDLDWEHGVSVQEKIDGSLGKIFVYKGRWCLATNGSIDAFKTPTGSAMIETFGELFEHILKQTYGINSFMEFCELAVDPNCTTMFEIVSPINRVEIPYDKYDIYYLGQRDMRTLEERNERSKWINAGVSCPKIYEMRSLNDVINAAEKLPWDEEGYVCVDRNYNRCKIKSPQYVMAHYARNNNVISKRRLIDIVLNHEEEEFLIYASDYADILNEVKKDIEEYRNNHIEALNQITKEIRSTFGPKEFFEYVNKNFDKQYHPFLLLNRDKSCDFEQYTKDWSSDKWFKKLGYK